MVTWITLVGLGAAVLTTISHMPQAIKSWKTKSTKDISLVMYTVLAVGVFAWLIYGFLIGDLPLILSNVVTFSFVFVTLVLKLKYG